jgi:hypothetical protein
MAVRVFKASVTLLTFEQEAVATSVPPALVLASRDFCRSFLIVRRGWPEGGSSMRFFG